MATWGAKRQLVYLSGFILVMLVIVAWMVVRNVDTTPTCFDGKQNGNETGIDCGGSCELICPSEARNIVVLWERPFKVTDGVYNLVAYFENQNTSAATREVPYRFRLYDEQNIVVGERTGTTFLAPNQRSAIFEAGVTTGNREPAFAFFELLANPTWVEIDTKWSRASLIVQNKKLSSLDSAPRLTATLENRTLEPLVDIEVVAILYDAYDNALSASQTYVSGIESRGFADVTFTWPEPFPRAIVRTEVIPRINIFSNR